MSVFYSVMPETFKLIVDRKDGISHNGNFESTHADIFSQARCSTDSHRR